MHLLSVPSPIRVEPTAVSIIIKALEYALARKGLPLDGATLAVLGLGEGRRVQYDELMELLADRGAMLRIFDSADARRSTVRSLFQALDGADAALIASDRKDFRELSSAQLEHCGIEVVLDACKCLTPAHFMFSGISYRALT